MAEVAAIALVASSALGAVSSIRQGYMESEAMNLQARFMERQRLAVEREAEVERQEAANIERERQIQEKLHEDKSDKLLSEYRARMARSGATMSGSPLAYLGEEAESLGYERELLNWQKRREGAIHLDKAKVLMAEAPLYSAQADIYKAGAKEAKLQGWIGAGSSLLKGVGGLNLGGGGGGGSTGGSSLMTGGWGTSGDHRF